MSSKRLITNPERATAKWITEALRRSGHLATGVVLEVGRSGLRNTTTATVCRLSPKYSMDAPDCVPPTLFLKVSRPDSPFRQTKQEFDYYTAVAPAMPEPPSVRCYEAVRSPETGQYHLLLEDVSQTHHVKPASEPLSQWHCDLIADCVARLHAFWWEDPRLESEFGKAPSRASEREYVGSIEKTLLGFFDALGDELTLEQRGFFERSVSSLVRLWEPLLAGRGLTLVHGDAHLWNILFPLDPNRHGAILTDWQFWGASRRTNDLAFMIGLNWSTEMREAWERHLLRRYHRSLSQRGVRDCDWDTLLHDYRLSLIDHLFTPMWQWSVGLGRNTWYHDMRRALSAFHDWRCEELLEV